MPVAKRSRARGSALGRKSASCRLAVFTHDTFGLGHVRRSFNIIGRFASCRPDASILFITGSPAFDRIGRLPDNADCVKIPTVVKTGSESTQPPHLALSIDEVTQLRAAIIRETVLRFDPDLFLVDNFALGSRGELRDTLRELGRTRTRTVLGLRDILDEPDVVKEDWTRQGIYDAMDRYYDRILVYGLRKMFNLAKAYGVPAPTARKFRYCGYVTDSKPIDIAPGALRRELGIDGPFVLATGGGGGDAFPLLSTFIDAIHRTPKLSALVVTGPLMSPSDRTALHGMMRERNGLILRESVPDMRPYLRAADVSVSMCGYNTASEIIRQRARAIIVPRTWKYGDHRKRAQTSAEGEQIMRARAMAKLGLVDMLDPDALAPDTLAARLRRMLKRPRPKGSGHPNTRGVETAVREMIGLLESGGGHSQ